MHIARRKTVHRFQYSIAGARLTIARHHPYLGVELCDTLKWNTHVTKVASKANRVLGFIRRNLHSCPEAVRQSAYFTLVQPQLEYASSTWGPFTQKNIAELEKVQRRSARFVKNDYRWDSSPTAMMQQMKWDSLAERRKARRLVMFYKSVQGETALQLPNHIVRTHSTTRYHTERFTQVMATTQRYDNSFYNRTIRNWNDLPQHTVSATSVDMFKARLSRQT